MSFLGAGYILVGANDGSVYHLNAVLTGAAVIKRRQQHIPDPGEWAAAELPVDRTPLAEMIVEIAPGRTGPRDPVQNQTMIFWPPAALRAGLDHERLEERPLVIRHQATEPCPLPSKSSLEPGIR